MNYREREQLEIWWKRLEQGSLIWREWQPYWGDELSGYMLEDDDTSYKTTAIAWYLEVIGPLVWNFTEQEKLRKLILIRAEITAHPYIGEVIASTPADEVEIWDILKFRILPVLRLENADQFLDRAKVLRIKLFEFNYQRKIAWINGLELNEIVTVESKKTALDVLERRERLMRHPNFKFGMRKAVAKYGWAWNILTLPPDALFSRGRVGQMEMAFDEIELHLDSEVHTQSSKGE